MKLIRMCCGNYRMRKYAKVPSDSGVPCSSELHSKHFNHRLMRFTVYTACNIKKQMNCHLGFMPAVFSMYILSGDKNGIFSKRYSIIDPKMHFQQIFLALNNVLVFHCSCILPAATATNG